MSGGTETRSDESIVRRRTNAVAAWALVAVVAVGVARSAADGDFLWACLGGAAVVVALVPVAAYREPEAMLPWEVVLFAAVPFVGQSFDLLARPVATFFVVPALALALAVEFDAFTEVEMSPAFAVSFVFMATMATAGTWAVVQWLSDSLLGTRMLRGLQPVMWSMAYATGIGVVAALLFVAYFRRVDARRLGFRSTGDGARARRATAASDHKTAGETDSGDWLHLSERQRNLLVRGLQAAVVVVLLLGLYERSIGVIVNAAVALVVMELPGLLERNYKLPIDARLTLWICVPVFLHAVGTLGLYRSVGLWDNLTHALSSSLVAAVGYTTVRAFDVHDAEVYLPRRFVAGFILLFTLAFGVLWELLEFGFDGLASWMGTESVLSQYSLANTMSDIVFDAVGGVVVAIWGGAYLAGVSRTLAARMSASRDSE
ncbi:MULTISPECIES: hypothetical protein [Halorussus]|uniref:hypothetical protein n=1 Tax=Halorussus TaxID=1070314 RepID=UPI0020A11F9B|nr:hypothetical protein [Halorussus vallis]USZ75900.1 hypothetical protein NGM07_00930 [Halorussus vallis]